MVNFISSVFILGSLLVQSRDLRQELYWPVCSSRSNHLRDNSFRGRDGHPRFRTLYRRMRLLDCEQKKGFTISRPTISFNTQRIYSICFLASSSSRFLAMRGRYFTVVCNAHNEKMSATGLLPWYVGRLIGFAGRGVRSVYLYPHQPTRCESVCVK